MGGRRRHLRLRARTRPLPLIVAHILICLAAPTPSQVWIRDVGRPQRSSTLFKSRPGVVREGGVCRPSRFPLQPAEGSNK